ncbi:MAG TPA: hypothetical protein VHM88_00840, partial [Candidatus Acidoferrales bacterium]|nr:hypothetical protein [Candidatus Acidoferrales bacterium]
MRFREATLFLISAAVLAYEVVLVRAFSIGQWYHFAYMVISVALLGFGASGALLAVLARKNTGRRGTDAAPQESSAGRFAVFATLFALALPVSFALAQKVPFDPFLIVWDRQQLLFLGGYYLVLFVPFFAAATAIGLAFVTESDRSPQVYFYNLVGSAAGAGLAVGLLELAPVEQTLLAIAGLAQGAAVLALLDWVAQPLSRPWRRGAAAGALAAMAALAVWYVNNPLSVRLSQYKGLSYALNLPAARVLATRSSALSRVDVVASSAIRHAPGLSLVAPPEAAIPLQLGLFLDAEAAGAITSFDGDAGRLAYLDWMSTAAPYFAREGPSRVCVLGAGGGAGVLLALRHGAREVDAVELDSSVVRLLQETLRNFDGALYARPGVRVHRAEARAFVEAAPETWDLM